MGIQRFLIFCMVVCLVGRPFEALAQVRASDLEKESPRAASPAPIVAAPAPLPPPLTDSQRLVLVNREIETLEEEMPSVAAPLVITLSGFGYSLAALCAGLALSAEGEDMPAFYISGIASAAVGLVGAIWWAAVIQKRAPYQEKIEPLEQERDELHFKLRRERAGVSASFEFVF